MASNCWPFLSEVQTFRLEGGGCSGTGCSVHHIVAATLPDYTGTSIALFTFEALPLHAGIGGQLNAAGPGGVAGWAKLDRAGRSPAANSCVVTHHIHTLPRVS